MAKEARLTALVVLVGSLFISQTALVKGCKPRDYGEGSVVCVCDSTYCDTYEGIGALVEDPDSFVVTISSKDGLRLQNQTYRFSTNDGKPFYSSKISSYITLKRMD